MNKIQTAAPQLSATQIKRQEAAARALREVRRAAWARRFNLAKGVIVAAVVLAIAAVALSASFQHLRHLSILAGQDATHWWSAANATPIVIDLMMFIASVQLRRVGITGTARFISRLCMFGGLLASIAGNIIDAWLMLPAGETLLMIVVRLTISAAPAVVLLGAVEMLTHTHKQPKAKARKASLLRRLLVALVNRAEARQGTPVQGKHAAEAAPVTA